MQVLVFILIGLAVGYCGGTLGIGGGLLLVPALMHCCGFEPGRAAGTSLAVLSIPVLLPATFKAHSQGRVEIEAVLWIAGAFALGAYAGAASLHRLPAALPALALGCLMIVLGVRLAAQAGAVLWAAAALVGVWSAARPGRLPAALGPPDYSI